MQDTYQYQCVTGVQLQPADIGPNPWARYQNLTPSVCPFLAEPLQLLRVQTICRRSLEARSRYS